MELVVTDIAIQKIDEAIKENNEKSRIRVYVDTTTCSGARFGLAFDDVREDDEITKISEIDFITDKQYVPLYSDGISIDYVTTPSDGFIIRSLRPVKSSCGSCSGCGK